MKCRRALTLIELLVVIAIIAILAALLLPVLSKAKNQSSKATDLNNLKQVMIAVHLYAGDNNDVLPMPNWDGGKPSPPGWLYTMDSTVADDSPSRFVLQKGLLWNVLLQPKLYVCPNDNLQMQHWSNLQQVTELRQQQLSSYAINGAITGFGAIDAPVKLAAMLPTDCAFWETDETEPFYFNDGANYPSEGVSGRHSQGGIQAAFDSSVSYVRLTDWANDEANTNKNRLWCYPNSPDGR